MSKTAVVQEAKTERFLRSTQGILQRKCACGNQMAGGGECVGCAKKKLGLQRKLTIGASNDPLEREADRVAEQVMAAPVHSTVNKAPLRIQRYAGQASEGGGENAPASVDRVLASSGRPMESVLRQDMEQRFGHDFSQVRVHSGAAAEQSAREVSANAYTSGNNIVFGAGQLVPRTHEGQRLIAHELTHVVQQKGRGRSLLMRQSNPSVSFDMLPSPPRENPCACLIHVHNDERNAKVVANALVNECDYNLIQVSPDSGQRLLSQRVRLPSHRRGGSRDPNELFDAALVTPCEEVISNGCDPRNQSCATASGADTNTPSCMFYAQVRECSNAFTLPVVALHNNVISDTENYRSSLGRRGGPTIGRQLFGSGKTNIFQWCRSPAIKRCVIGDRSQPDHVVWTSNENDFLDLAGTPGVNVALQDETFTDTDLSSLFNIIPSLPSVNPVPGQPRYVNIETPHQPRQFDASLAEGNLNFVSSILERLGIFCCPPGFREQSLNLEEINESLVDDQREAG